MLIIVGGSHINSNLILQIMDINKKIGEKIHQLRNQKSFSIEHLANIADIDRNYLSDIEKGKRNVSKKT
jgi:predicted transcriptional regulator